MQFPSLEQYEAFFNAELAPKLKEIGAEWPKISPWMPIVLVSTVVLSGAWVLLMIAGIMYSAFYQGSQTFVIASFVAFLIVFPPIVIFISRSTKDIRIQQQRLFHRVKDEVILKAIAFMVPEFYYDKDGHLPEEAVRESRIFNTWKSFSGDDLFKGRVGETEITFSEISLQNSFPINRGGPSFQITLSGSSASGRDEEEIVHQRTNGLMLIADFNKQIFGTTLLYPDHETDDVLSGAVGTIFGAVEASLKALGLHSTGGDPNLMYVQVPNGLQLVRMEDPEFERVFKVFTDDPLEANYILTPSFMQRLTAFRENAGHGMLMSFLASKAFVYLPAIHRQLFEIDDNPGPDSVILSSNYKLDYPFHTFEAFHADLAFALGIVDDLNLNTRIWSKGAGSG